MTRVTFGTQIMCNGHRQKWVCIDFIEQYKMNKYFYKLKQKQINYIYYPLWLYQGSAQDCKILWVI